MGDDILYDTYKIANFNNKMPFFGDFFSIIYRVFNFFMK